MNTSNSPPKTLLSQVVSNEHMSQFYTKTTHSLSLILLKQMFPFGVKFKQL